MKKRLFITYFVIAVVAMLGVGTVFFTRGYQSFLNVSERNYMAEAELIGTILESHSQNEGFQLADFVEEYSKKYDVRITVVTRGGEVLAESSTDYDEMENHSSRIEIQKAIAGEKYCIKRFSETLGMECMYCAIPLSYENEQGVLRIAVPLKELKGLEYRLLHSISIMIVFIILFMLLIAVIFSDYMMKPIDEMTNAARKIAAGDLKVELSTKRGDQLSVLAKAFNTMAEKLRLNMDELNSKNSELEAILYSMDQGVVALDDENNIIFCNQQFKHLIDWDKDNITGISIYHVLRNQVLYDIIDKVTENQETQEKEGEIYQKEECVMRMVGTPLYRDGNEELAGVLVIFEDITKMRRLERMRSDFVSNVSHEFKTPLTSIKGFVDTLKNGAIQDPKVATRFLDIIDIETERLSNLIQDILVLSEIENNAEYNVKDNDIKEILQEVSSLLESKTKDGVELNWELDAYIKPYACNADRMKQLFINLIDNAMKYTEQGSVTVECYSDGNFLYFSVKDTGKGIEKEHLGRIFERFYRVDKGRSSKTGGTGLGLSIVKHIVEMYNGDIEVESQVGVGTKFLVKLPYER